MCSLSVSMSWGSRTHNVYSEGAMAWTSFRNRSSSLAPPALLCTWSTAVLRLAARSPKAVPVPSPIPRSNAVAASRSWFNWSKNPAGSAAPTTGAPSTAGPTAGVAAADAPTAAAADVPATGGDAVARPSPAAVAPAAVARPSPTAEMRSEGLRTRVRAWDRAGRWVGGVWKLTQQGTSHPHYNTTMPQTTYPSCRCRWMARQLQCVGMLSR
jgi:hypothetical protein